MGIYRLGNPEEKCASVISGLLFAGAEKRMTGEDSSSAHEPCTELARARGLRRVWPHLGEWMGGSSVWPRALGQTSRWSLIIFLSCSS